VTLPEGSIGFEDEVVRMIVTHLDAVTAEARR
jgi:hypothetical protein